MMTEAKQLEMKNRQERKIELIDQIVPVKLRLQEDKFFEKFQKHKGNPLTKLKLIYSFTDEIYGYVYKVIICKKGCSYCCYIPVSISEIEIEHIENSTRLKRKKLPKFDIRQSVPCPLLKDNMCSIYEYRPFLCRRFITLNDTPEFCYPDVIHTHESLLFSYSEINKAYSSLIYDKPVQDIREVFKPD